MDVLRYLLDRRGAKSPINSCPGGTISNPPRNLVARGGVFTNTPEGVTLPNSTPPTDSKVRTSQ